MQLHVKSNQIFIGLFLVILALLAANITGIVFKFYFNDNAGRWFIPLFDFNTEKNIPTLYSAFILFCACILLSRIAVIRKNLGKPYFYWSGLAIIFFYLSIDETISIHEMLIAPVTELLHVSGLLFYAWVIPYGLALLFFVAFYFNFLISLPKKITYLFILSGATFVTGAIGLELLGGRQHDLYGDNNVLYACLYTCEEFFEMLGMVLFIYTLLLYINNELTTHSPTHCPNHNEYQSTST